jgi:hypothetical protein
VLSARHEMVHDGSRSPIRAPPMALTLLPTEREVIF